MTKSMDVQTQTMLVKQYLETGKRVTSMNMFALGITRLSSIIYNLRHRHGLAVVTTTEQAKNGSKYAVYTLLKG